MWIKFPLIVSRNPLVVPTVSTKVSDVNKHTAPLSISSKPRISHVKMATTLLAYSKVIFYHPILVCQRSEPLQHTSWNTVVYPVEEEGYFSHVDSFSDKTILGQGWDHPHTMTNRPCLSMVSGSLKRHPGGNKFSNDTEVQGTVVCKKFILLFFSCIELRSWSWTHRWHKCNCQQRDYVGGKKKRNVTFPY